MPESVASARIAESIFELLHAGNMHFVARQGISMRWQADAKHLWPDGTPVSKVCEALNKAAADSPKLKALRERGQVFRQHSGGSGHDQCVALTTRARQSKRKAPAAAPVQVVRPRRPSAESFLSGQEVKQLLQVMPDKRYTNYDPTKPMEELQVPPQYAAMRYTSTPAWAAAVGAARIPVTLRHPPNLTAPVVFLDWSDIWATKRMRLLEEQVLRAPADQRAAVWNAHRVAGLWFCMLFFGWGKCKYHENCFFIHADPAAVRAAGRTALCQGDCPHQREECRSSPLKMCPFVHRDQLHLLTPPQWWRPPRTADGRVRVLFRPDSHRQCICEIHRKHLYPTSGLDDVDVPDAVLDWCSREDCCRWRLCTGAHISPQWVVEAARTAEQAVRDLVSQYTQRCVWFQKAVAEAAEEPKAPEAAPAEQLLAGEREAWPLPGATAEQDRKRAEDVPLPAGLCALLRAGGPDGEALREHCKALFSVTLLTEDTPAGLQVTARGPPECVSTCGRWLRAVFGRLSSVLQGCEQRGPGLVSVLTEHIVCEGRLERTGRELAMARNRIESANQGADAWTERQSEVRKELRSSLSDMRPDHELVSKELGRCRKELERLQLDRELGDSPDADQTGRRQERYSECQAEAEVLRDRTAERTRVCRSKTDEFVSLTSQTRQLQKELDMRVADLHGAVEGAADEEADRVLQHLVDSTCELERRVCEGAKQRVPGCCAVAEMPGDLLAAASEKLDESSVAGLDDRQKCVSLLRDALIGRWSQCCRNPPGAPDLKGKIAERERAMKVSAESRKKLERDTARMRERMFSVQQHKVRLDYEIKRQAELCRLLEHRASQSRWQVSSAESSLTAARARSKAALAKEATLQSARQWVAQLRADVAKLRNLTRAALVQDRPDSPEPEWSDGLDDEDAPALKRLCARLQGEEPAQTPQSRDSRSDPT
eukprot:TRINITY_DN28234_c0_g1_i1.p1 TRINITY_DN28234_c0_g1~~TRINITY_DN28234_c0_g1_i1.p1  ORF type:complete len:953 (+),score=207.41 TRINITY_DN28234_c0_g1_i1:38-2860(+)